MDKRVVFHIDDIGSSISANRSAFSLLEKGYASAGSIIVPGNGFGDILIQKRRTVALDLGIHLTLTSERSNEFLKRKPTLSREEVPSLVDAYGYFWPTIDDVFNNADPYEIKKELINQIQIAKNSGIEISHIDSHMGVLLHKRLFSIYQELIDLFRVQPFIVKPKSSDSLGDWFYGCDSYINCLESKGFKIFDDFNANSLYEGQKEYNIHCTDRIEAIREGSTYFLLHVLDGTTPNIDKTPDYKKRQDEYNFFSSNPFEQNIMKKNIKKISMKEV